MNALQHPTAAARPGFLRRLHNRVKARYLNWQLKHMRKRLDKLEADMKEARDTVVDMARLHRHSPALQQHRRAMREEHEELAAEWMGVRNEIDTLEALP